VLVILFDAADIPYIDLYKLELGKKILSNLPLDRDDPKDAGVGLAHPFTLKPYINSQNKFLVYEG
jgi:hypothetical protein